MIVFELFTVQDVFKIRHDGGEQYTIAIFVEFSKRYDDICVCYNYHKELDENLRKIIANNNYKTVNISSCNELVEYLTTCSNKNVFFYTGLASAFNNVDIPDNVTRIGTIHAVRMLACPSDVISIYYYEGIKKYKEIVRNLLKKYMLKRYRRYYKRCINNFDVIIVDTEHAKYDLKIFFPDEIENKDIKVYYAISPIIQASVNNRECFENDYIMMVAGGTWIKNCYRGVKALDELYSDGLLDVKTRVYGDYPKGLRNKVNNRSMFEFYNYVSSEELDEAYKNCRLFMFPSLYEGFGLPPLEAMKYGKTCAISAHSCLPEVYKNSVYYFNPYDINSIKNEVLYGIDNPKPYEDVLHEYERISNKIRVDINRMCELFELSI